jgi:hypothetical protein
MDMTASNLNEKQNVDGLQEKRLNGEEITGHDLQYILLPPTTPAWKTHKHSLGAIS